MISIKFKQAKLPSSLTEKQAAATMQMRKLLDKVDVSIAAGESTKYQLLSPVDRRDMLMQGFAQDLVDNFVYITEASLDVEKNKKNSIQFGFTEAAFDSSLYATESIYQSCSEMTSGCCIYCESPVSNTGAQVSHHCPPWGETAARFSPVVRPGAYTKAYDLENLVFSCVQCALEYKAAQYPLIKKDDLAVAHGNEVSKKQVIPAAQKGSDTGAGPQKNSASATGSTMGQPLLIHPYHTDPRLAIRFNPYTACAYAFDQVAQFYQDWKGQSLEQTALQLWASPESIPKMYNSEAASMAEVDDAFTSWRSLLPEDYTSCGDASISVLGLNRKSLVRSRLVYLRNLRARYIQKFLIAGDDLNKLDGEQHLSQQTLIQWLDSDPANTAYRSLSLDAVNTWQCADKQAAKNDTLPKPEQVQPEQASSEHTNPAGASLDPNNMDVNANTSDPWLSYYDALILRANKHLICSVSHPLTRPVPSAWVQSSLMYLVAERELDKPQQRRLVCMHATDRVYGSGALDKVLLVPIEWEKDKEKKIIVKGERHQWQTSFAELIETKDMSLLAMFASNELWVLGDFPELV